MDKNGIKWTKMNTIDKNGQKWNKMDNNGIKWTTNEIK